MGVVNPQVQVSKSLETPTHSESQPSYLVLGEELIHALGHFDGVHVPEGQEEINTYLGEDGRGHWEKVKVEELQAHGIGNWKRPANDKISEYPTENSLRAEHGLLSRRAYSLLPPHEGY
jgi:Effector protein